MICAPWLWTTLNSKRKSDLCLGILHAVEPLEWGGTKGKHWIGTKGKGALQLVVLKFEDLMAKHYSSIMLYLVSLTESSSITLAPSALSDASVYKTKGREKSGGYNTRPPDKTTFTWQKANSHVFTGPDQALSFQWGHSTFTFMAFGRRSYPDWLTFSHIYNWGVEGLGPYSRAQQRQLGIWTHDFLTSSPTS